MSNESNQNISEADLIKGSIEGDRRIQEKLYRHFSPKMYAVCLRYAGHPEDAQDILQEGFVKVFRNLEKYRAEGSFEGWVRRIFVNTAIEHYRKSSKTFSITESQELGLEDPGWTALDHLNTKDILEMIQELSPGYRTVFNLYVIEGYTHREIADMMQISEGTSKSQLARAKALLQHKISERIKRPE